MDFYYHRELYRRPVPAFLQGEPVSVVGELKPVSDDGEYTLPILYLVRISEYRVVVHQQTQDLSIRWR